METTTSTTTTTTTTTTSMSSEALKFPYVNYNNYFRNNFDDIQTSPKTVDNDYYYDDAEDSCEFCKRKSQKITFKEFCKNDLGKRDKYSKHDIFK